MNAYESNGIKLISYLIKGDGNTITVKSGKFAESASNLMNLSWFVGRMKKTFNIEVLENEVSCEVYSLCHQDLVDLRLPVKQIETLPIPLLFEKAMYVDEKGNEWNAGVVLQGEKKKMFYELWLKNGEPIAYELYVD
ncbi:hypothetical protein [Sporosarcina sp. JAI121]|uniref:hypothetical protein n=1 Tax=Sporosarcina sp. JAI121 TaxID=2723064 RepID=UPI00183BD51D|nr:hypothetical protein [Sporosarcina sp. JAI121]NYF23558.1 hypothetical protein [Sporosarcina sp. JAI121]